MSGDEDELYGNMQRGRKMVMNMIINKDSEYPETIPVQRPTTCIAHGRHTGYFPGVENLSGLD
jgi:hypothetical protein